MAKLLNCPKIFTLKLKRPRFLGGDSGEFKSVASGPQTTAKRCAFPDMFRNQACFGGGACHLRNLGNKTQSWSTKKMKSLIALAATAAVLAVPAVASAQSLSPTTFYGSIGYANAALDDVNLGAVQGRLGARFGQYVGVEGEVAGGVKEDSVRIGAVNVDVELKHQVAIYGVGYLPLNPQFDLLARVGYGNSKIEASALGAAAAADGDSWNYGVGGQYFFDEKNGVRVDYTRHDFKDSSDDADVWAVAYTRKF
jgi:outer membrane immunogenic protein